MINIDEMKCKTETEIKTIKKKTLISWYNKCKLKWNQIDFLYHSFKFSLTWCTKIPKTEIKMIEIYIYIYKYKNTIKKWQKYWV